jgi:hypothetical protein
MIADPIDATRFWLHDDVVPYTFTDAQIQEFLDLEKVVDDVGIPPSDTVNWTPSYDVLRAAGRGWMWLAGQSTNKQNSYTVGDVSVTIDKGFCLQRARELMGGASHGARRRDERQHYSDPDYLDRYRP